MDEYKKNVIAEVERLEKENPYMAKAMELGALISEKNKQYGNSINDMGEMLKLLYPNGIKPEQYGEMAVVVRVLDKIKRIANGNLGNEDAWEDLAGYGLLMSRKDGK